MIVSTPMSARLLCLCGVVAHLLPLTLTSNSRVSVEQRTADYRCFFLSFDEKIVTGRAYHRCVLKPFHNTNSNLT